ncbi:MAG: hypothetical protein WCG42_03060 [Parachlamydiaceae bacterium]
MLKFKDQLLTNLLKVLLFSVSLSCMTACYRMPGPDDYSLIPSTNNPAYTKEKGGQPPGIGY